MDYNNYKTQVIFRVGGIALNLFILFQIADSDAFALTVALVFFVAVAQVVALIKYLDKIREELKAFFDTIRENDFTKPVGGASQGSFSYFLQTEFNEALEALKKIRLTRDDRLSYLTTIVQHVGIGLITFNKHGKIQIINTAAKKLLRKDQVQNIEELRAVSDELINTFHELKTGGRALIKLDIGGDVQQMSVYAIELTLGTETFKLVSLQNIRTELEENEMEAWQKLVRVLTHEIMNSVTPISSLATTIEADLAEHLDKNEEYCAMPKDDMEDVHLAVQTIQRRSEGLIRFVNDFRSLTHTPNPKLQLVAVGELFDQVGLLLKHELETNGVRMECNVDPPNLAINLDHELIQQVLINLIKNAIQALGETTDKQIQLLAKMDDRSRPVIMVIDNGAGIDEEALPKVFIPFFTTKRTGSGIGLSLSRQIMRQHQGSISVKSTLGEGTTFTMRF